MGKLDPDPIFTLYENEIDHLLRYDSRQGRSSCRIAVTIRIALLIITADHFFAMFFFISGTELPCRIFASQMDF